MIGGIFNLFFQLIPLMMPLLIWGSIIALGLMFALYFAIALVCSMPLIYLISIEHPKYSFIQHMKAAFVSRNLNAFKLFGVIFLSAGAIGLGFYQTWFYLSALADGREIVSSVISVAIWATVSFGAYTFFDSVNKGKFMTSIFDLMDNPAAMQEFASGTVSKVVFDINPDRDIPLIKQLVIGQDEIVELAVKDIYRMSRREIRKKPLGVFLLVGSSGAGKTELAKAIAKTCFEGRMSEHFMNQFKSESDINQLFGPPPGYVGSDKGGKLTQEVKKLRSCVILLDEIEKCHKSIFDSIMTLLDEGRMTDASTGEVIDATNCVIIMTSNAEQKEIGKIVQEISDPDDQQRAVKDKLQSFFKPEHLARMSLIAPFKPLDRTSLIKIIGKFLLKFAADNKVKLVGLENSLVETLVLRHEKNSDYGIRNLITLIERDVEEGMSDARDLGFTKVRINMVETGKLDKSGEPISKPQVVGVPDDVEVKANQASQSASKYQTQNEMKG